MSFVFSPLLFSCKTKFSSHSRRQNHNKIAVLQETTPLQTPTPNNISCFSPNIPKCSLIPLHNPLFYKFNFLDKLKLPPCVLCTPISPAVGPALICLSKTMMGSLHVNKAEWHMPHLSGPVKLYYFELGNSTTNLFLGNDSVQKQH